MHGVAWTKEQEQHLRDLWDSEPDRKKIASQLNRSIGAISSKATALGLLAEFERKKADISRIKLIPCLRCRKEFKSVDYVNNRICEPCTRTEDWQSGIL